MIKLEYKEQFVLTTDQIAKASETSIGNIRKNYHENKDWFEEGVHYYTLKGAELKELKSALNKVTQSNSVQSNSPNEIGSVQSNSPNESNSVVKIIEAADDATLDIPMPMIGKKAAKVQLWTRRGLIRHSHFLTTKAALQITERMEEVYFAVLEGAQAQLESPSEVQPLKLDGREVWTIRQAAEQFGRTPRQIYKALSTKQFKRGTDYYVTSAEELSRLRDENAMWIPLPIIVILASGWAKLMARYRQLKAAAVTGLPETVLNLESKLQEQMQATLEALKAFVEIKAALG